MIQRNFLNLIVEIIDNQKHITICKENLEEQIKNAIVDRATTELKTTNDYYKIRQIIKWKEEINQYYII